MTRKLVRYTLTELSLLLTGAQKFVMSLYLAGWKGRPFDM
jgi:hypothetical protein